MGVLQILGYAGRLLQTVAFFTFVVLQILIFSILKGLKKMSTETQSTHSSSLLPAPACSKNRGQILVGITTQRFGLLPEKKWSFC